jgi:hypothetical protein
VVIMVETIRACRREDVPVIADLFMRVLSKQKRAAGPELKNYFERLVFEAPEADENLRSRVFVDAGGRVRGYIGILPQRMLLGGKPILAAAAGSLMVESPKEHPTAGARLLRAFLSGPQDLSFSETANDISQRMWVKAGGERLPSTSLDWVRVLRPAGFAVWLAARRMPLASWLRPLAAGADHVLDRYAGNPFLPASTRASYRDADVGSAELGWLIPQLASSYTLHPAWEPERLQTLLAHAKRKERYGTLFRRVVHGQNGRPSGCYLYYGRPGGMAWVLQVLALPEAVGDTLDSLMHHAADLGCVGVRGRVQPDLLDSLLVRRCVLFHVSATMVHARNKDLLAEVRPSRSLLTGLAGEGWTRLIGGEFA